MPSTATTRTIYGLTNGTAVQFRVAAVNGIGTGAFSTASAAVTPIAGDSYFSSVSLLLPFNGNLTDASSSPKTMTAFGGAAATGAAKYGSASLSLNGSNQYLSTPDSDGFTFSGDFTIESWVQLAALPASGGFAIVQSQGTSYTGDLTYLGFYNDATVGMTLSYTMNTGGNYTGSNFPITASAGQWYHIAMVRSANTMMLYFNGTRVGTASITHANPNPSSNFEIGRYSPDTTHYFNGLIDDFRVSSVARYTGATITVPTAAFPTA